MSQNPSDGDPQQSVSPQQSVIPPMARTLKDLCEDLRRDLLQMEVTARALVKQGKVSGEAAAQAMLSVRHLEDARMRFGKVIQYSDGNVISIYDTVKVSL